MMHEGTGCLLLNIFILLSLYIFSFCLGGFEGNKEGGKTAKFNHFLYPVAFTQSSSPSLSMDRLYTKQGAESSRSRYIHLTETQNKVDDMNTHTQCVC